MKHTTTNFNIRHALVSADAIALPPDRFGLVVGRAMYRVGVPELPVTKDDILIGTLMLTTATHMGVTITVVAWERLEAHDIQQLIYDCDGQDQPLSSGIFGSWDAAGLARLDAHRLEIMEGLIATVAGM
jgi:hypothetical protein